MSIDLVAIALKAAGITIAAGYILRGLRDWETIAKLFVSVALTLLITSQFAPKIHTGLNQGMGFNMGGQMVGGMGMQTALNMQKKLKLRQKGQNGGGIQAALGLQRTLNGQPHISEGFSSQYQQGGMDDKVAVDYYSPKVSQVTKPHIQQDHAAYDTLIATELDGGVEEAKPAEQVNTIERFIDDRMALDYYERDRGTKTDVHEAFESHITNQHVPTVEAFDGDNTAVYQNYKAGVGPTAGERGLVYGTLAVKPGDKHNSRIAGTLYSGDLITLTTKDGAKVMLVDGSSFVRAVPADKASGLGNKLFKFRMELVQGHSDLKMVPIKYNDMIKLVYNDGQAQAVTLNHSGDLNNLKNNRDIIFKLVRKDKPDDKSVANLKDEFVLRKGNEGVGNASFLKVNGERMKIETDSSIQEATVFTVAPQKGCGPLWRFDSDTRGTDLMNPSQVREIVQLRTKHLTDQIATKK